jgi:hypothetical protein
MPTIVPPGLETLMRAEAGLRGLVLDIKKVLLKYCHTTEVHTDIARIGGTEA